MTKLKYLFFLFIIWFLSHIVYATIDGLTDNQTKADVAIVLGNKVNEDGSISSRLQARLDQAILLYKTHRVSAIIVSGGLGKEGFWEAEKMTSYLSSQEIPESVIWVDNYGNDTELTVKHSMEIMQQRQWKSAISVTQFFHQTRTKMLFKKAGLHNIESSSPQFFTIGDFYSSTREFIAFYIEAIK